MFFLENRVVSGEEAPQGAFTEFDYAEENIVPEHGIVRFAPEDELGFANTMGIEKFDGSQLFYLDSAKFWANFSNRWNA